MLNRIVWSLTIGLIFSNFAAGLDSKVVPSPDLTEAEIEEVIAALAIEHKIENWQDPSLIRRLESEVSERDVEIELAKICAAQPPQSARSPESLDPFSDDESDGSPELYLSDDSSDDEVD